MISVVIYGRNDNYGYNLHKRAAISLNCIAELLTDDDDEILFVDYNTPNDYPTFPEAIQDVLTDSAKDRLKIFRVRPYIHNRLFGTKTHLNVLEPIARNVAVRRSNPNNKWVLSSNSDMIFAPRKENSLTSITKELSDHYYCTPRFDIPECIWEEFDRLDPKGIIEKVKLLGWEIHLNQVIFGAPHNLFDAPGDFQLILRDDLFNLCGFDESMTKGWHVDSNIFRRLYLKYKSVGDLSNQVFGYHCDHTRQVTPMHIAESPSNDIYKYVDSLTEAQMTNQNDNWGLAQEQIEQLSLSPELKVSFYQEVKEIIGTSQTDIESAKYVPASYGKEPVNIKHTLPFLIDIFSSQPKDITVLWLGDEGPLFNLFNLFWQENDFSSSINIQNPEEFNRSATPWTDIVIIDFGLPVVAEGKNLGHITASFLELTTQEVFEYRDNQRLRKFVGINCIHNDGEYIFKQYIGCARTPFSPRLLHGFLLDKRKEQYMRYGMISLAMYGSFTISLTIERKLPAPYSNILSRRMLSILRMYLVIKKSVRSKKETSPVLYKTLRKIYSVFMYATLFEYRFIKILFATRIKLVTRREKPIANRFVVPTRNDISGS